MTSLVASLTEAMDAKQAPPNSTLRFDFAGMLRGLLRYYRDIGAGGTLIERIDGFAGGS